MGTTASVGLGGRSELVFRLKYGLPRKQAVDVMTGLMKS